MRSLWRDVSRMSQVDVGPHHLFTDFGCSPRCLERSLQDNFATWGGLICRRHEVFKRDSGYFDEEAGEALSRPTD
jgi:hypothetical protein